MRWFFFFFILCLLRFPVFAQEEVEAEPVSFNKLEADVEYRKCGGSRIDTIPGKEISFSDTTFSKGEIDSHILKQTSKYGKWSIMMYVEESVDGYFRDHDSIFFQINGVKVPYGKSFVTDYDNLPMSLHLLFYNPYRMNKEPAVPYSSGTQKLLLVHCWSTVTSGAGMGSTLDLLFDVTNPKKPTLTLLPNNVWSVSDVNCDGLFDLVQNDIYSNVQEIRQNDRLKALVSSTEIPEEYQVNYYSRWTYFTSADGIIWIPAPYEIVAINYIEDDSDSQMDSKAWILFRNWPY